jgi:hypothetical protein
MQKKKHCERVARAMYFYKIPAGEREALDCWNFVV